MSPLDEYITMKALGAISGRSVRSVMNMLGDSNSGVQTIKGYASFCAVTVPTALKYLEEGFQLFLKSNGLSEEEFIQSVVDQINNKHNEMIDDIVTLKLKEGESLEDAISRVMEKHHIR